MTGARIAALLKQNGWAINLVFILVGSYFVSGAANAVVARSIRVVPSVNESPRAAGGSTSQAARVEYQSIAARNLLGAMRENLNPVVEEEAEQSEGLGPGDTFDPNDLRACTLSASLRGTLVSEEYPEWSLAVLYVNAEDRPTAYSINEGSNQIAEDATLVEVRPGEIIVRRRDHFERCQATEETRPPPRASRAPRSSESSESSEDDDGAIQKTGDNEWAVDREYLEKEVLENLSKVATQARIVPSFKNGKPDGFKLFSIKPRSIYSKIGLQNGDVIHKINGYEMNSPDKALEIYQKLKDASSVQVELTRRGQKLNQQYSIK